MALVSFLPPVRKAIPHEPEHWMDFRKPASRHVRAARKAAEQEGRQGLRDFGAEIVKALQSDDDEERTTKRIARLQRELEYDPDLFDRAVLLRGAIADWSYCDPESGKTIPVDDQSIGDLDEQTARWAVQQVIDLMRPPTPEADKSAPAAAPPSA